MMRFPLIALTAMHCAVFAVPLAVGQNAAADDDIPIRTETVQSENGNFTVTTPLDKDGNPLNVDGFIGAMVGKDKDTGEVVVREVGASAESAGLALGDVILKVGDYETTGKDLQQITFRLRGKVGTQVTVTVRPLGTTTQKEVVITRKPLSMDDFKNTTRVVTEGPLVPSAP